MSLCKRGCPNSPCGEEESSTPDKRLHRGLEMGPGCRDLETPFLSASSITKFLTASCSVNQVAPTFFFFRGEFFLLFLLVFFSSLSLQPPEWHQLVEKDCWGKIAEPHAGKHKGGMSINDRREQTKEGGKRGNVKWPFKRGASGAPRPRNGPSSIQIRLQHQIGMH